MEDEPSTDNWCNDTSKKKKNLEDNVPPPTLSITQPTWTGLEAYEFFANMLSLATVHYPVSTSGSFLVGERDGCM
jgi:hypothetical protein